MGQKVHPYGFRLGYNKDWHSHWFAKTKQYGDFLHEVGLIVIGDDQELVPQTLGQPDQPESPLAIRRGLEIVDADEVGAGKPIAPDADVRADAHLPCHGRPAVRDGDGSGG